VLGSVHIEDYRSRMLDRSQAIPAVIGRVQYSKLRAKAVALLRDSGAFSSANTIFRGFDLMGAVAITHWLRPWQCTQLGWSP
jgi:hypothetical protein